MDMVIDVDMMDPLVKEFSMVELFLWLEVDEGIFDLEIGGLIPDFNGVTALMWAGLLREVDISESSNTKVPFLLMFWVQSCSTT